MENKYNLNNINVDYLTNSEGEENLNSDEIPPTNVYRWYCNACVVDSGWLQYLVKVNDDEYGILAIYEIPHDDTDDWEQMKEFLSDEWVNSTPEEKISHIEDIVRDISSILDYDVLFGKETGVFRRHEIAIFFPHEYIDNHEVERAFESIDPITNKIMNINEWEKDGIGSLDDEYPDEYEDVEFEYGDEYF